MAHVIEKLFEEVNRLYKNLEKRGEAFSDVRGLLFTVDEECQLVINKDMQKIMDPREIMMSFTVLSRVIDQLFETALQKRQQYFTEKDHSAYARLSMIFSEKIFRKHTTMEDQLRSGLYTAMDEGWSLMLSIPLLFEKQYGRSITPEEFDQVMKSTEHLLTRMASSHLEIFGVLARVLDHRGGNDEGDYLMRGRLLVWSQILSLHGNEGKYHMDFRPEFVEDIQAMVGLLKTNPDVKDFLVEVKHGCPAMYTSITSQEDKKSKSSVQLVMAMYKDIAHQAVLPNQQLLIDSFYRFENS